MEMRFCDDLRNAGMYFDNIRPHRNSNSMRNAVQWYCDWYCDCVSGRQMVPRSENTVAGTFSIQLIMFLGLELIMMPAFEGR